MRRNKLLACLLVSAMVVLSACQKTADAPTQPDTSAQSEVPTQDSTTEAPTEQVPVASATSIDFEDGNCAFAITNVAAAVTDDAAALSVVDYNGSKALFVENVNPTKIKVKVAFDVESLLGDKLADVASLSVDIATEHDDAFAAISGNIITYTGENATETKNTYSVYLAKANPKTIKVDLGDNKFVAGAKNYIEIAKEADAGATAGDLYIDNITFYDANGNVIVADTTVELAEDFPVGGDVVVAETVGKVFNMNPEYAGDWGATPWVPVSFFDTTEDLVQVTVNFLPLSGFDYYLLAPMTASWTRLVNVEGGGYADLVPADSGSTYHLQEDGFIVIDDHSLTSLTFTMTKAAAEQLVAEANEEGALGFQTYGVTPYEVIINDDYFKVSMNPVYAGDWGATPWIPASFLEDTDGPVQVTVKFLPLSGFDYYLLGAMSASWTKLTGFTENAFADMVPADSGTTYHLQADGFMVIDDHSLTEFSFTLTESAVAQLLAEANEEGALGFQTYGVTPYEIIISDKRFTVPMTPEYAGDWGATPWIPAAFFENADSDLRITVNYLPLSGFDYYLLAPMSATWTRIRNFEGGGYADMVPADSGTSYHLQDDGFIVIDDHSSTSVTFTITKEAAAQIAAEANEEGAFGFQTYGVTPYEVIISSDEYVYNMTPEYAGDWGATPWLPVSYFEDATDPIQLTVKFLPLSGFDYYLLGAMTASWTKLTGIENAFADMAPADSGSTYHLQADGFMVIDDHSLTEFTFTITPEAAAAIVAEANEEGALGFQTYGVTPYQIIIRK